MKKFFAILCLSLFVCFGLIQTIDIRAEEIVLEEHDESDDVFFDEDDCLSYEDYLMGQTNDFSSLNGMGISFPDSMSTPENKTATQEYDLINLPSGYAVQKTFVATSYIYVVETKRVEANGNPDDYADVIIARCSINNDGTSATYQDKMTINGCGHDQCFELYQDANGHVHAWINCKPNSDATYRSPTQLGRITYQADVGDTPTITNYTQIIRFSNLNCANKYATSNGMVWRAETALSTNKTKLLLLVKLCDPNTLTVNKLQYSYYDVEVLDELLDDLEANPNRPSNYISFQNNNTLKNACEFSCVQTSGNITMPFGSCQGVELTNGDSIYIAGNDKTKTTRRITKLVQNNTNDMYQYYKCFDVTGIPANTELEGLQIKGTKLYFAVSRFKDNNNVWHNRIYSLDTTGLT